MPDVDTNGPKRRRNKRWPAALKREIVAATYLPGSSVSIVARQIVMLHEGAIAFAQVLGPDGVADDARQAAERLIERRPAD